MSKDVKVVVWNYTANDIKVHDRVAGTIDTIESGHNRKVTGNRGADDDVIIGIMNPSLANGQTVGKFRFENPNIGYAWMKSDWSNRPYYMRGYAKLKHPYKNYDYVVQSNKDQRVATGKLPRDQSYYYGKAVSGYDPEPASASSGVWALNSSSFDESKYLTGTRFEIIANQEVGGYMKWTLNVLDVN